VLERLRAIKSPEELDMLRIASDAVIDSMAAVIKNHGAGATKAELTEALRREETSRGLTFDYCLITAGSSLNRAPSEHAGRRATSCRLIPAAITRLHWRRLPHGHHRRTGCRARGSSGRSRSRRQAR